MVVINDAVESIALSILMLFLNIIYFSRITLSYVTGYPGSPGQRAVKWLLLCCVHCL